MSHEPDLVAYVTGELPADQAAAWERRERDDPAFAAEVAALRRVVVRLADVEADGWAPASPPPLAVDRSAREPAAPRGRLAALGARLLGGAAGRPVVLRPGLAAGLAAVLLLAGAERAPSCAVAATTAPAARRRRPHRRRGRWSACTPWARGRRAPAPRRRWPPAAWRWTSTACGAPPRGPSTRSGSCARPSTSSASARSAWTPGRAAVRLPVTVDPRRFPIVDVSVEAADGDPAHSTRSVLRSAPIS